MVGSINKHGRIFGKTVNGGHKF